MFNIYDNKIMLTRGDTAVMELEILDVNSGTYEGQPGDTAVFTVKKDTITKEKMLQKVFNADGQIRINPEETESWDYGTYYYDVELTQGDGVVQTIITPTEFYITDETTF